MSDNTIMQISGYTTIFSFLSILFLFTALLEYGITNDYILYNLQNITEGLEAGGNLLPGTSNETQQMADSYYNFNFYFDNVWFLAYALFLISSFIFAYKARPLNYFGFLYYLVYGIMFVLFVLSIFEELTRWFYTNIFLGFIPTATILLPKFTYYLDHIGVLTTIQVAICLILNLTDFDFSGIAARRRQEEAEGEDEEVV